MDFAVCSSQFESVDNPITVTAICNLSKFLKLLSFSVFINKMGIIETYLQGLLRLNKYAPSPGQST